MICTTALGVPAGLRNSEVQHSPKLIVVDTANAERLADVRNLPVGALRSRTGNFARHHDAIRQPARRGYQKRIAPDLLDLDVRQVRRVAPRDDGLNEASIRYLAVNDRPLNLGSPEPLPQQVLRSGNLVIDFNGHFHVAAPGLAEQPDLERLDAIDWVVVGVRADQHVGVEQVERHAACGRSCKRASTAVGFTPRILPALVWVTRFA